MKKILLIFFVPTFLYSQQMQTITIDEAIQLGLQNSKALHQSSLKVEAAQAKSSEVNTARLPSVKLQAGYTRLSEVDLVAVYPPFGDHPTANDVRPILNTIIDRYKDETVDDVRVLYTNFKSTVVQESKSLQVLPAPAPDVDTAASTISNFEPDVETVVDQVTTRLIEAQLWQAVLESLASEHAMRMLATKNATDNANDLIDDYTLALNTARQADITQQIAEISGGAEALNG